MPTCLYADVCGRDALEGHDGACILHSERADKDRTAFEDALAEHVDEYGPDFRRMVFPDGATFPDVDVSRARVGGADLSRLNFANESDGDELEAMLADGVEQVQQASTYARRLFVGLLLACAFCWLTIFKTMDADLIANSASSPLPIIGTQVRISMLYIFAPVVLILFYVYFHLQLQRLWGKLALLPSFFPDGKPLDRKSDPWLLLGMLRDYVPHLNADSVSHFRLQRWVSILVGWALVPMTLVGLTWRFVLRESEVITTIQTVLTAATIAAAFFFYRKARTTLSGINRDVPWVGGRLRRPTVLIVELFAILTFAYAMYPWNPELRNAELQGRDLTDYRLAGQDLTGANLRGVSLEGMDLTGTTFTRADLREANLQDANLSDATLSRANLQHAHLDSADLESARLRNTDLRNAHLDSARLDAAQLPDANLHRASLIEADLQDADLSRASLRHANLRDADLTQATLRNADLRHSNLNSTALIDTDFRWARLDDVDLGSAVVDTSDFSHADLTGAQFTYAILEEAKFRFATLTGASFANACFSRANLFAFANLTRVDLGVLWRCPPSSELFESPPDSAAGFLPPNSLAADSSTIANERDGYSTDKLVEDMCTAKTLHGARLPGQQAEESLGALLCAECPRTFAPKSAPWRKPRRCSSASHPSDPS